MILRTRAEVVSIDRYPGEESFTIFDVFDRWFNKLNEFLEELQWVNPTNQIKGLDKNMFNMIIDSNITQRDIYDLIMKIGLKEQIRFKFQAPQDNACLVLKIKDGDWSY